MKRIYAAAALLAVTIAVIAFGSSLASKRIEALEKELGEAVTLVEGGDFEGAETPLAAFEYGLNRGSVLLAAFVDRELIDNARNAASSMRAYLGEETRFDFLADASRTFETLEIIRSHLSQLF